MANNIIDSIQLSGVTYDIQGEITIDAAFDSGSTNPVENRVITPAVTKHFEGEYPTEYTGGYSGGTYVGGFSAATYEESASYVIRNTTYITRMYKDGIRLKFIDAEGVETEVFACSASTYYNKVYNPPSSYATITIDTVGKNIEITPLDNYKLSYVCFYEYYDNNLTTNIANAFSATSYQSFDKTAIQLIDDLSAQKQDKIPISAGTGINSIIENNINNTASGQNSHAEGTTTLAGGSSSHAEGSYTSALTDSSHAEGSTTLANGRYSHAEGNRTKANGMHSHAEGSYTNANGMASHAEGYWTTAATDYSHTEGYQTITTNQSEHASGQYNVSNSATTTFGDSGNTLFSVGNGDWSARHNAFEIRQNGDIYLSSGGTDIKLQDHLGGGSSYTAGDGIDITNDVISVTGKVDTSTYNTFTAATDTALASKADTATTYTKTETDNLVTAATSTKQDTLVSGTNIKTINNESLLGSGNITIQGGGNPTVELTQAEYDALVTAGTVSADTYYIITDAQAGDLTNYYTKTETNTLLGGKQATLVSGTNIKTINNESILGSGNIDIQGGGGGGKAIEAGRGIAITTGETADTVSFDLPISAGTNVLGVVANAIKMGENTTASSVCSFAMGSSTFANGYRSFAGGVASRARAESTFAYGYFVDSLQFCETAFGRYNVSNKANSTWGDSGNTLFSVGNGTADNARHNAFEIRQNGDIYITINGQDVKLQDILLQLSGTTS